MWWITNSNEKTAQVQPLQKKPVKRVPTFVNPINSHQDEMNAEAIDDVNSPYSLNTDTPGASGYDEIMHSPVGEDMNLEQLTSLKRRRLTPEGEVEPDSMPATEMNSISPIRGRGTEYKGGYLGFTPPNWPSSQKITK